jgi:nitrate reductase molybdenum cofactor assembly chaperone NarJ/NarW
VNAGMDERAVVLQAASVLMQYPDDRVLAAMPTVQEAAAELRGGSARRHLLDFLDAIRPMTALQLQEHYVETLDRKRRCCLYLTWWTEGETRRRGLALAQLKQLYRDNGFVLVCSELPDFLPVILEFAAVADVGLGLRVLQDRRAGLELLRLALLDADSPYAALVEAVCALLPGRSPQDEAAARALARSGPPGEQVGLEPYGSGARPGPGPVDLDLGPTSLVSTGPRR